ncbi:helix-turn-helix transcriptional regulator [Yeosuana marina]|uniref:helix-turn-helix domain-containing protein n=1 Tax=Yeosuana marina TaxID=1565536 RepID=UPI0030C7B37C
MVNTDEFAKRLQIVIDYYGESASSFAEKIGVQRSSISHILSGRNKPSLEFVLKILSSFPEVELYWLLNGKGNFPTTEKSIQTTLEMHSTPAVTTEIKKSESKTDKVIERIVIFYSDGSFKNYQN